MSLIELIHGRYSHNRRVRVLSDQFAKLIPRDARVLDVGCGDGFLARLIMEKRPDVQLRGIDVLVRNKTSIPVDPFDGQKIPYRNASFDAVMLVDVLHHTKDPIPLLSEAARVAREAILIKDHTLHGLLASSTLRFMDWVGNARYGVALPYTYWSRQRWLEAFDMLDLEIDVWKTDLSLYPRSIGWIFDRSLHFIARLHVAANTSHEPTRQNGGGATDALANRGCSRSRAAESREDRPDPWEAAYSRFETPEQEIRKFTRRLKRLGADVWRRDAEVLELFCGRGNGLHALSGLGFTRIEGVDLSDSLLSQYRGPAVCHQGDSRRLPFHHRSRDIVIIQGGLHHLQALPADLERTLSEAHRVLRDDGLLAVVEPWSTPFLSLVHVLCRSTLIRRVSRRVDALAEMIDYERRTYEQWLAQPNEILGLLQKYFEAERCSRRWGKLMFLGRKRVMT